MGSNLSPGFLVAAPALLDPNFRRSVVLLVDHREEGSLGFVINRPGEVSFEEVIQALSLRADEVPRARAEVLVGGPVAPETGWILFDEVDPEAEDDCELVRVTEHLAVSASRELLVSMLQDERERRMLLALGYASWGPGQLDSEISQGAWIAVDLDERIVFETPYEQRWAAALAILGIDPARLSMVGPSDVS